MVDWWPVTLGDFSTLCLNLAAGHRKSRELDWGQFWPTSTFTECCVHPLETALYPFMTPTHPHTPFHTCMSPNTLAQNGCHFLKSMFMYCAASIFKHITWSGFGLRNVMQGPCSYPSAQAKNWSTVHIATTTDQAGTWQQLPNSIFFIFRSSLELQLCSDGLLSTATTITHTNSCSHRTLKRGRIHNYRWKCEWCSLMYHSLVNSTSSMPV